MTNDELLHIKKVAELAKPFTGDDTIADIPWEDLPEEEKKRLEYNQEIFQLACVHLPEIIDELLSYRNVKRE